MSASGVDKSKLEEDRPRHPAGHRLHPRAAGDAPQRAAERPAAPGLGRRDRALHDLPRAPRRSAPSCTSTPGWNGIASTHINYPCGTFELAETVADLVRQAPDPGHAVIGLAQPRSDHHRRKPGRDLRPHRRQDPAPGADELTDDARPAVQVLDPELLAVRAADRLPLPAARTGHTFPA